MVTGAASGIGLALARALASRVASVVLVDRDGDALERAARADDSLSDAHLIVADVRDVDAVEAVAQRAAGLGTISIACLNAGVTSTGPTIWDTPISVLQRILDVNVVGTANCIRSVVPRMIAQPDPSAVVITASMAGLVASPNSGAYAASKAATVALAKALRGELAIAAPHVQVSCCCPGMVRTNLMRTSADALPGTMADDIMVASHDALNTMGIRPEEQATSILDAVGNGSFWVLPPTGDLFNVMLDGELGELSEEITR